jgi:hypothetical protein
VDLLGDGHGARRKTDDWQIVLLVACCSRRSRAQAAVCYQEVSVAEESIATEHASASFNRRY